MYTYLLLNIGTLLGPLALSFDKRVAFFKRWKALFPAILITALVFIVWDVIFTEHGVWGFNPEYLIGIDFFGLPLEEILFFFTVPYALVFIYACLTAYLRSREESKFEMAMSLLMVMVMLGLLIPNFGRWYSTVCLAFGLGILIFVRYAQQAKWMHIFFLAYLISLVPFLSVNGVLTALPVVTYNPDHFSTFRLGSIPVEDLFYSFSLFLMNVSLFEFFMARMGIGLNTKQVPKLTPIAGPGSRIRKSMGQPPTTNAETDSKTA